MSESVSGVDAIIAGLRRRWTYPRDLPDATQAVPLADAEAAVHATVREIVALLQGPELEACWFNGDAADEVARRFGGMT